MTTCIPTCIPTSQLFNDSAARINIFDISTSIELLDAYIGLIANDKLQADLRVMSFLLKDRVSEGDLWEIVGECTIEARQEVTLRQHLSICVGELKEKRHVMLQHLLMEEKKKRSQMEMSLYSQAIEHLQQKLVHHLPCSTKHGVRSPSVTLPDSGPSMETCSFLDASNTLAPEFAAAHRTKRMSVIFNCIGPSLPLLSTWATIDVQEAFYSAFCAEQACQASLLSQPLLVEGNHAWQHNVGLELIILQSKIRRAQAEVNLYAVAIGNAREHDFTHSTGAPSSPGRFIPPPLPDELCYYDHDIDDEEDDSDDFEF